MLDLRNYRSKARGLDDLLPYAAMPDNGIVLNKDGSLTAAWEFRGLDTASSTMSELDQVAVRFNHATLETHSGLMLHVDAVRMPTGNYPDRHLSHFPDPVSQMIEDERRAFFAAAGKCYQTHTILTVTYMPNQAEYKGGVANALRVFKEKLEKLEVMLASIPGFSMERLLEYQITDESGRTRTFSAILSHLQFCITGDFHPVLLPEIPMYLDAVIGGQDVRGGLAPKIGQKYIRVLALDSFPGYSYPAMLQFLDGLPMTYRFSTRFICLDNHEAARQITLQEKGWNQQTMGFMDKYFNNPNPRINPDALLMVQDAQAARLMLTGGEARFGYLTTTIILMDENAELLKERLKLLITEFNALGFVVRDEDYNCFEAWQGSLPGNHWANERRPLMNTLSLAHLLPLASVWPGHEVCPCPLYPAGSPPLMICTTDGSTPFRFNLHENDVGHTLVFGPTGAGKSTFLALTAAQFRRYQNAKIFVFDKGMSMFPLVTACGGDHLDLGAGLSFAPFQWLHESEKEFLWLFGWLEILLELVGVKMNPAQLDSLNRALEKMKHTPAEMRNMTLLPLLLDDPDLKMAFNFYTVEGGSGQLWEASRDCFGLSDFMVFEMASLFNMGPRVLLPVLFYLFRRIERSLKGQPTLLILDEAWKMLQHANCRKMIIEWLKELRKANCAVILATQALSDVKQHAGILEELAQSCLTKIYLANYTAEHEFQKEQYLSLGLNSRQVQIIANATPKQDYYITSPSGRRLVQLAVGKKSLAFVGASSTGHLTRIRELIAEHGDDWTMVWLTERRAT